MEHAQTDIPSYSSLPASGDFTNISLDIDPGKKKKVPRRLIHFSDGVLEEYSTDEEEDQPPLPPPVDPKTLTWGPWMWYYLSASAFKAFGMADTCGEKLAWFFGITSPKYQSAIDEFYRLKAEEEREEEEERRFKERSQGDLSSVQISTTSKPPDKDSEDSHVEKY